ncbi:hypothetical protein DV737_g2193, partial [Chaetothyriales sp. CBS 132003]
MSGFDEQATSVAEPLSANALSQPADSIAQGKERAKERVQADEYVTREYLHKALLADQINHAKIVQEKKQELARYTSLRQLRDHDPGAVFGLGYGGFGNPRTDDRTLHNPIVYPRHRRPGKRKTLVERLSRKDMAAQAEQVEELVPIRLDIEWGKIKLRDTFTWNLNDRTTNIAAFAEKVVEDFGLEVSTCKPLILSATNAITEQITDYCPQIYPEDEALNPHLPYSAYKNDEMRILVKLNITIGQNTLIDQFEWDVNNPLNSPEDFARQMTNELSLAGEFTTAIAHSIREQCQLFTKSLHLTGHAFDGRQIDYPDLKENFLPSPLPVTFRPYQSAKDYGPYIYELNEADLERTELSLSREQRRQKRSTNRRGGPALPDLKDRPRTIRSLVVSSVIPGGALTMEDSRIFRMTKVSRRAGRRAGADDFEDSDASESEDSGDDSQLIPTHLIQTTAKTRSTMRTAALSATANIRNISGLADEESEPEKLVVKLRISPEKLRKWARDQRNRDRPAGAGAAAADSPLAGTHAKAMPSPSPLKLAGMPPPTSTANPADPLYGAVEATNLPTSADRPAPPLPEWLKQNLEQLGRSYPKDRFEGTMKHVAIEPKTNAVVTANEEHKHFPHKFVPRIRCLDCPGKIYIPVGFESHLRNKKHRETVEAHYSLNNPDTLTKYKTAAGISQKVLAATILHICEKGDKLLDDEISKVYKGKKIVKGIATPTTVSPSSYVTPFTPLVSDPGDAAVTLKAGELVKIQLGAQIDGFGAIAGNTIVTKIISLIEKVAKAYGVQVVQHTTSWQFERNDIEGKKKIILSPSDATKGEGHGEVGDVWGVEVGMSLGSGKVKDLDKRSTLLRRTALTYGLKRPSSRQILSEIVKKFGTFPFSLRQLDDEKAGKVGVVECVRAGVLREYKPSAEADGSPTAITKNGITRLAAPPPLDLSRVKSDKEIEDEEILKILSRPLKGKATTRWATAFGQLELDSTRERATALATSGSRQRQTAVAEVGAVGCERAPPGQARSTRRWRAGPVSERPPSFPPAGPFPLTAPLVAVAGHSFCVYQDHKGLERVGVLELQQPLGELPSAKLLQRLKLHLPRPSPRPASQPVDEVVTPSVESDRPELASPMDAMDVDAPVELVPAAHLPPQQPQSPAISSPPRGRPAKRDIAEMRRSLNPAEATPSPAKSTVSPPAPTVLQRPASIQEHLRQDRVQSYVETAILEAEQNGDQGLVPGLRKMRERALHQRELWAVLDAIAHSQPTEEQLGIFKKFIKKGVKRHRRSIQTPPHGAGAGVGVAGERDLFVSRAAAAAQQRPPPPEPLSREPAELLHQLPHSSAAFTPPFRQRSSSSHLHLDHAASDPIGPSPSSRRLRMAAKEQRRGRPQSVDHSPRHSQSRSNSASSSLSSAKSIPDEFAPPTADAHSAAADADERPVGNGVARQANPPVSRTRSTALPPASKHPFAAFPEVNKLAGRRGKGRKEYLGYDPVEVAQRRERYLADSYQAYNTKPYPVIDDRHHVTELDHDSPSTATESLVPPPVVHHNPVHLSLGQVRAGHDASDADDNDEFCASCGGGGVLLCCDGCTQSMHHRCLIPPLDATKEVDGEWFCPVCVSKRNGQLAEATGLLGKVIQRVDGLIPKAFTLPHHIRDYFEGIRTGESGEYEEYGQPANQQIPRMNRAGFIEEPNYKELRDSKGKLITCYRCGLTSNGRDIIPCSYCPARWHLDCCDPPLATPPRRRAGDKAGVTWRCPLHVEHDLAAIGSQDNAAAGDLGRQPRPRRPKNARPLDVDLTRGFRNNGVIEVELEPDKPMPSIRDVDMRGQIFRLPEKGIRLDFIDRVKRSWYEDQIYPELIGRPKKLKQKLYQASNAVTRHEPISLVIRHQEPDFYTGSQALAVVETAKANAALRYKTFAEQQTILGLVQMSKKGPGYSGDALADLANQLIIDAPPEVEKSVQRTEKDRLLQLQGLINRRLKMLEEVDLAAGANAAEDAAKRSVALKPLAPKPAAPAAEASASEPHPAQTLICQSPPPEQTRSVRPPPDRAGSAESKGSDGSVGVSISGGSVMTGGSFTETANCDSAVVSGQTVTPPAESTAQERMGLSLSMPSTVRSLSPPLQDVDSTASVASTAQSASPHLQAQDTPTQASATLDPALDPRLFDAAEFAVVVKDKQMQDDVDDAGAVVSHQEGDQGQSPEVPRDQRGLS